MKTINYRSRGQFSEAFRTGIEFAIAVEEAEITQLFEWTTCKDFINDFVYAEMFNTTKTIYSFTWTHMGVLDKPLWLMVRNTTINVENLEKVLEFWESKLGIEKTEIFTQDDVLFIKFLPQWYEKPYLISLVTLLATCSDIEKTSFESIEDFLTAASKCKERGNYFNEYRSKLIAIYNNTIINHIQWNEHTDVSTIHNSSGFTGITA